MKKKSIVSRARGKVTFRAPTPEQLRQAKLDKLERAKSLPMWMSEIMPHEPIEILHPSFSVVEIRGNSTRLIQPWYTFRAQGLRFIYDGEKLIIRAFEIDNEEILFQGNCFSKEQLEKILILVVRPIIHYYAPEL